MDKESLHIHPADYFVQQKDMALKYGHQPLLVWLTGLSGSGKSTIAAATERRCFEAGLKTYHLDGDNIRRGLNSDLDFSVSGRRENIRRIAEVAGLFVDSNTITFAAFISPFRDDRNLLRKVVGSERVVEVFVDCPLEICEQRDVKGLYKLAREGKISNFTGISSPYEVPESPDIYLNTAEMGLGECVTTLFEFIIQKVLPNKNQ